MAISFDCPHCQARVRAPEDRVGQNGTCPKCRNKIVVPEPIHEATLVEEAEEVESYPLEGEPGEPAADAPADRRPCPVCGELIVAGAAKCRYCGEVFDPELRAALKKSGADAGEDLSTGDWIVALLCSGIGCIAGIVWMIQGKPKGKKMFLVSLIVAFFWGFLRALVEVANQR